MSAAVSKPPPAKPPMQIWGGYTLSGWWRLLARNHFVIEKGCRLPALGNTIGCALSSVLARLQEQQTAVLDAIHEQVRAVRT